MQKYECQFSFLYHLWIKNGRKERKKDKKEERKKERRKEEKDRN